jgi:hypothetical protein
MTPSVSIGGDDSWYIVAANDFLNGIRFPQWHGCFYPIIISPVISICGVNIILLKILSIIIGSISVYLLHRLVSRNYSIYIAFWVCLIYISNYSILLYSGSTYSEPLFMLLQTCLFLAVYDLIKIEDSIKPRASIISRIFLLSLILIFLGLTRNVGWGAIISTLIFLIVKKKYFHSLYTSITFIIQYISFEFYKNRIWDIKTSGFSGQLQNIAYKDFYDHAKGKENLGGYIIRIWENAVQYLSNHLMKFFGFLNYNDTQKSAIITLIIIILFIIIAIYSFKKQSSKNKFIIIYLTIMLGGTFFSQQVHWNQERLILIYFPYILILGIHFLSSLVTMKPKVFQLMLSTFLSFILFANLSYSCSKCKSENIIQSIQGNTYFGFTADWINYLTIAEWAEKNIDIDKNILCRKPNMAEIYSDRKFIGISRLPSKKPTDIISYMSKNKVDYIISASLRVNPKKRTNRTIQTVPNLIKLILSENPSAFRIIRQHGNIEPAILLQYYPTANTMNYERIKDGLQLFPENVSGNYYAAYISYKQKKYEQANFHIKKAATKDKNSKEIKILNALIQSESKNYPEAIRLLKEVLKSWPNDGETWYNLAVCYYHYGDKELFQRALNNAKINGFKY